MTHLLKDSWIPVVTNRAIGKISYEDLLCSDANHDLNIVRDDLEMGCLQLLICMTQAFFTPSDASALTDRIDSPMTRQEYLTGIQPYLDWFQVDHPRTPFMQITSVKAKGPTPLEKLLPGVTGATNSCFVNPAGLGEGLCGGCCAIALFHQAGNVPSFGGGFKPGLRGSTPVTTLIQEKDLRRMVWRNVLHQQESDACFSVLQPLGDRPNWVDHVSRDEVVHHWTIGILRGLFWQPAHVLLSPPGEGGPCRLCGQQAAKLYREFTKEKFSYTLEGLWPHPHSPTLELGTPEERFDRFDARDPAWFHLNRFVAKREANKKDQAAAVISQAGKMPGTRNRKKKTPIVLIVGGYTNNQASILQRCHEEYQLAPYWEVGLPHIEEVVHIAVLHRDALYRAIGAFRDGVKKKMRGLGLDPQKRAMDRFYLLTELPVRQTLATIDFNNPHQDIEKLRKQLNRTVHQVYDEIYQPYSHDPRNARARAIGLGTMNKALAATTYKEETTHAGA